jgi:hypothetical protein
MPVFLNEGAIYQEAHDVKTLPGKAIFKMVLQDADIVNQNKRLYPMPVLEGAIESTRSRVKRKAFFGELDHPFITNDEAFNSQRQTTVSLKEISHIIRDFEFRGNQLIGEIETASTPKGSILLGLIKDQAGIGMSMRGLAELERGAEFNTVRSPLTIIAFDSVSSPSHVAAVVDFNEMTFESHLLTENTNMVCLNGKCFLPNYFDKLVESKCIKFFENWV